MLPGARLTDISIHALLAESDSKKYRVYYLTLISIHALLAESDFGLRNRKKRHNNFYPRSPCGERRPGMAGQLTSYGFLSTLSLRRATKCASDERRTMTFLSTLSLRRATPGERRDKPNCHYFYPRSPCGERPMISSATSCRWPFLSTLSLRRATSIYEIGDVSMLFLSTLSLRRATLPHDHPHGRGHISIHALLAESDRPASIR